LTATAITTLCAMPVVRVRLARQQGVLETETARGNEAGPSGASGRPTKSPAALSDRSAFHVVRNQLAGASGSGSANDCGCGRPPLSSAYKRVNSAPTSTICVVIKVGMFLEDEFLNRALAAVGE
jgi:hypothetical protein